MSTDIQQSTFKNLESEHGILSLIDWVLLLEIVQNHDNEQLWSLLIPLKWEEEGATCL